ncbi:hypothetical protein [Laspinema olomoucense]|uniref:Uncharacterized protein n=1 Tax=Laspinema olomoucense D3b TaxID=2953688 RepID=A0ABT2NA87_9CYAN|nr:MULTISPECIES: hypothetical protein [unclassified Laspinema]MCT7974508.1 hypothetical protein [Laspinema sp. D3d]MCT7979613.1 hypothetical protein [Laspinema sp. D3b]MCT7989632.1 hypothetical protein [Laspinema sp. D3a]MCT7993275.1 hypothetical protein [Laspinema sp. D3c]
MNSSNSPNSEPTSLNPDAKEPVVKISSELLITLLTPPFLGALLGGKAVSQMLQSMGQASEEVFRGDRLPVLNFPHSEED